MIGSAYVWVANCADCGFCCEFADVPGVGPALLRQALRDEAEAMHSTRCCRAALSLVRAKKEPHAEAPA